MFSFIIISCHWGKKYYNKVCFMIMKMIYIFAIHKLQLEYLHLFRKRLVLVPASLNHHQQVQA